MQKMKRRLVSQNEHWKLNYQNSRSRRRRLVAAKLKHYRDEEKFFKERFQNVKGQMIS